MNEDEMQALEPLAGEELERHLARYARVRLDPTPAQSRRARSAVMEAAWRQRIQPARTPGPGRLRRHLPFAAWGARRLGASLTAAVLAGLLVGSVAFGASRAGGPLYEARIAFEMLTLPSDPDARLEAEIAMAQSRLAELVEAAGRGDGGAVEAALAAYEHSLDDLELASGEPADRALEAVQFHRTVLLRLVGTVPAQALAGLENALDRSSGVIDKLDAAGGTGAGAGGSGTGGSSNGSGGGNPGAGGASNGSGGGNPGDKPDRTAAPPSTPKPEPTPKPGKTAKPAPSEGQGEP